MILDPTLRLMTVEPSKVEDSLHDVPPLALDAFVSECGGFEQPLLDSVVLHRALGRRDGHSSWWAERVAADGLVDGVDFVAVAPRMGAMGRPRRIVAITAMAALRITIASKGGVAAQVRARVLAIVAAHYARVGEVLSPRPHDGVISELAITVSRQGAENAEVQSRLLHALDGVDRSRRSSHRSLMTVRRVQAEVVEVRRDAEQAVRMAVVDRDEALRLLAVERGSRERAVADVHREMTRRLIVTQEALRSTREVLEAERARSTVVIAAEVENARKAHADRKATEAALAVYQNKVDPADETSFALLPADHHLRAELRAVDRKRAAILARMRRAARMHVDDGSVRRGSRLN